MNPTQSGRPITFGPNWRNIIFLIPFHLIGLFGWPIYLWVSGGNLRWPEIVGFGVMYLIGVLGVDVSYHRSLSHLSFRMSRLMKFLFVFGASSTAEGSALAWCTDHRRHHRYQDTDKDPYNINRGFWWAHWGWIFLTKSTDDFSNIPDLKKSKLLQNQHRYYWLWFTASSFLLPAAVGLAIGRFWPFLLLVGFTRLMVVQHVTFCINSWAHYFGKRPYSTEITARDSFILALLGQGEGWHNYHHRFPFDYRNGHRFYHYDSTKWIVYFSHLMGWASDLRRTPAHEIYRARIQTQRQKLPAPPTPHFAKLEEALDSALARWRDWTLEMNRLKTEMGERSSHQMRVLRENAREAKREFQILFEQWKMLSA